jgi:hypothetical protein
MEMRENLIILLIMLKKATAAYFVGFVITI